MNNLFSNQESLVSIKHNTVITTSKQIAITFGKRHDNVLADIRDIATTVPNNFAVLNFKESIYNDSQGKRQPMYELTRDGFTLLAMGFTGKRALEFKLAYINAFNEMERKLSEPKVITVKSHIRRVPRKKTVATIADYDKIKLMVLATEFLDRANTAVERAQRFTMALDCVTAAYGITRAARGL